MEIVGLLIIAVVMVFISAAILMVVDKLNMGLNIGSFGNAVVAAIAIAVIGAIINWLLGVVGITIGGGFLGAIVHLVVAAVVLLIAGSVVSGFVVEGFGGAIIAAIAIGVVGWLLSWVLGLLGLV